MDLMVGYNKFASEVAEALNKQDVKPLPGDEEKTVSAVMVMVAVQGQQPMAGSLNYINEKWEVQIEMAEVSPA